MTRRLIEREVRANAINNIENSVSAQRRPMIYLVNYSKKSHIHNPETKPKSLIFIEARESLALNRVIGLLRKLTDEDLEESSVEIIGQKSWDTAKINTRGIRFYKLD